MANENLKRYAEDLSNDSKRLQKVLQEGGDSREGQINAAIKDAAKDGIQLTAADFDAAAKEPAPAADSICVCIAGGGGNLKNNKICACVAVGVGTSGSCSCSCVAYGHGA